MDKNNNDTTNYLYVFKSDSFLLSKVILINYSSSYSFYGSSSGYPYSFVLNSRQDFKLLQYNGNLKYKMSSFEFTNIENGGNYFDIAVVKGNTTYFIYSKMMNINSIQFGFSTYISKMTSFFELETWQNYKFINK